MNIAELVSLQKKSVKKIVGLMSGTSLDGVDAVLIEVEGSGTRTKLKQKAFLTYPFPQESKNIILRNAEYKGGNVTEICKLNFLIAHIYADAVKALCKKAKVKLNQIDLVGSHGQTIHHLPQKEKFLNYQFASTLQIGDPSVLAKLLDIPVIGEFRVGDVALGGQGAPLVPYFDFILFHSDEQNRALLNIGGISNITILNKNGKAEDVIAFDTGPGNMLIDQFTNKFFNIDYDQDGLIAATGIKNENLFESLKSNDKFLLQEPPKSTGREFYGKDFVSKLLRKYKNIAHKDWLTTITDYTAFAVFSNYENFIKKETEIEELFVSGGGSHNKVLMRNLKSYFGKQVKIKNVSSLGMSSDSKEAICFAVLANETLAGNSSNIPKVTGAFKPTILGKICLP